MNTAFMIRAQVVIIIGVIILAGFNVARFFDLLTQGWPALTSVLAVMIGGKTLERVKELTAGGGAS